MNAKRYFVCKKLKGCESGYYKRGSECVPCDPGYYCIEGSNTPKPMTPAQRGAQCRAGRYGHFGRATEDCTGQCHAGYYCPMGSGSAYQNKCGEGRNLRSIGRGIEGADFPPESVFCRTGSALPTTVDEGHYTTGGDLMTMANQSVCEIGHYCTRGRRDKCPSGTWNDVPGLSDVSQCQACDSEHICPGGFTKVEHVDATYFDACWHNLEEEIVDRLEDDNIRRCKNLCRCDDYRCLCKCRAAHPNAKPWMPEACERVEIDGATGIERRVDGSCVEQCPTHEDCRYCPAGFKDKTTGEWLRGEDYPMAYASIKPG